MKIKMLYLIAAMALTLTSTASAKTFTSPTLTAGVFTFDIPRVPSTVTLTVTKGGGYVKFTTDTGETQQRWYNVGIPYTANFVSPYGAKYNQFQNLASTITITGPVGSVFTVDTIVVQDRFPAKVAIQNSSPALIADGTVTNALPDSFVMTVTSSGYSIVLPTGAATIPISVYDAQGNLLGVINVPVPVY